LRLHISRQRICREAGKLTLEAAIILPIIIVVTVMLTYMGAILYQYYLVSSVVNYTAIRASEVWDSGLTGFAAENPFDGSVIGGYIENHDLPLYRRLAGQDSGRKEDQLAAFIVSELEKKALFKNTNISAKVQMIDCLLYRKVVAAAEVTVETPVREFAVAASSESIIKDPAELIRNTDFVFDIKKEIEELIPDGSGGVEKMTELVNGIWEAIVNLFR
jgi:hypothetical protein